MVGINFFKERIGDIFSFSLIKYICGNGQLSNSMNINVTWEINLDITGKTLLVLTSCTDIPTEHSNHFLKYTLRGHSNDSKWSIKVTNLIIFSSQHDSTKTLIRYICDFNKIELFVNDYNKLPFDSSVSYITNFNFNGINSSPVYNKGKKGAKRDCFSCDIRRRHYLFKQNDNIDSVYKLIQNKRITTGILLRIVINTKKTDSINLIFKKINEICWLLSLLDLNTIFSPLTEILKDNLVIYKCISRPYLLNYHNLSIIDNFYIRDGVKSFIDNYFTEYVRLTKEVDLKMLINILLEMQQQSVIDIKFSQLLLGYELILTKYLLNIGEISTSDISSLNIETKSRKLNKHLRFIPKRMFDKNLRENVRNPLFHQGYIPLMGFRKKYNSFISHYELLIQILLRLFGYNGKYLSRLNYEPKSL